MTTHRVKTLASTTYHHRSHLRKALGVIPYQPLNDEAHIFYFDEPSHHRFHTWLVFTPIDLIFLQDNTVVETTTMHPFTTKTAQEPFNHVIELPPGVTDTINEGDTVYHAETNK